MKIIDVGIASENVSIAIIISRFNQFINDKLLSGALDTLRRIGQVKKEKILKIYVPGTNEIPVIAHRVAKINKYHAIIAIGTIIRGNTDHFKYIANTTYNHLTQISIEHCIPITLGILTTENLQQAIERSGAKMGNKGSDAALAALEMINIMKKLKK